MNNRQLWEKYGHVLYFHFIFLWSKRAGHRKTKGKLTPHFWDFFGWTSKSPFAPATGEVQRRPLIKFNAVLFFGEARWLSFTDGGREWVKLCKLTGLGWIYIHRNLTPSLPLKIGWKNPKGRQMNLRSIIFQGRFVKFRGCTLAQIGRENDEGFQDVFFSPFFVLKIEDFHSQVSLLEGTSHFYFGVALQPSPTQTKRKMREGPGDGIDSTWVL